jgi:hypothetical protein
MSAMIACVSHYISARVEARIIVIGVSAPGSLSGSDALPPPEPRPVSLSASAFTFTFNFFRRPQSIEHDLGISGFRQSLCHFVAVIALIWVVAAILF